MQLLAFFLTDVSVAAFVWYIFYAAYYKIRKVLLTPWLPQLTCFSFLAMVPVDNSAIVTSVWLVDLSFTNTTGCLLVFFFSYQRVFMTAKWTCLVWLFARLGIQQRERGGYETISDSESQ